MYSWRGFNAKLQQNTKVFSMSTHGRYFKSLFTHKQSENFKLMVQVTKLMKVRKIHYDFTFSWRNQCRSLSSTILDIGSMNCNEKDQIRTWYNQRMTCIIYRITFLFLSNKQIILLEYSGVIICKYVITSYSCFFHVSFRFTFNSIHQPLTTSWFKEMWKWKYIRFVNNW